MRMERKRIGGEKSKREECVIGRARRWRGVGAARYSDHGGKPPG